MLDQYPDISRRLVTEGDVAVLPHELDITVSAASKDEDPDTTESESSSLYQQGCNMADVHDPLELDCENYDNLTLNRDGSDTLPFSVQYRADGVDGLQEMERN